MLLVCTKDVEACITTIKCKMFKTSRAIVMRYETVYLVSQLELKTITVSEKIADTRQTVTTAPYLSISFYLFPLSKECAELISIVIIHN